MKTALQIYMFTVTWCNSKTEIKYNTNFANKGEMSCCLGTWDFPLRGKKLLDEFGLKLYEDLSMNYNNPEMRS